ncbi:hypothetical protein ACFWY9_36010 [Amycolatopsis sp. NPDC059027]|uniref:hypothetical protein n=1 Tax=Amycolatopsis sp. NPDC059027 TaxID=3346709 RepID=UPI003670D6A8
MFFALARRIGVVFACGVLAVLGVLAVPAAGAADQPRPPYTLKTEPASLAAVQDGDPVKVTLSGLPAGATARLVLCPRELRDNLLKRAVANGVPQWVPEHDLVARVRAYCNGPFGDELTGRAAGAHLMPRTRSATTGEIVFDTAMPRGAATPHYVTLDPDYTSADKNPVFPWANNPVVSTDPQGGKIRQRIFAYSCDENHPCMLAVEISVGATTWIDDSLTITPAAPGLAVRGCGGVGQASLTASMPQRFGRTAVAWNQLLCAPTKAEQPANIVSETEDTGLKAFDTGDSDVMVTGSGGVLAPQAVRSREYVPVGLNAVVVAAVGWAPTDRNDAGGSLSSRVTDTLSFTYGELANMLTKGGQQPDASGRGGIFKDGSPLVLRNPVLGKITGQTDSPNLNAYARAGTADANSGFFGVTGEAGTGTVPFALSSLLASGGAGDWVFPNLGADYYGGLSGKPPGVISEFGALDPGKYQQHNIDAKVGQFAVRKVVDAVTVGTGSECTNGCLNWVITDLATARAYGWTPVALPDGKGGYVAPTKQSLQAAAATMTPGADGTLRPGTASGAGAYPLTFAEYLTVPVNPLIDANCRPQQAKQQQLKTFAQMVVNGGQSALAPGLAPLTPDLAGTAADRAAKIGTGTVDAACKEKEEAKNPPPPGAAGPGSGGTPAVANAVNAATSSGTPMAAPEKTAAPTHDSVQAAKNLADSVRIPTFLGAGVLGALIPLLALVILAALPSGTAYVTAGRPVPPWLSRASAAVVNVVSGLVARIRGQRG